MVMTLGNPLPVWPCRMSQIPPNQQQPGFHGAAVNFAQRPPSASWESVSLAECPQCCIWVWFKPPGIPFGLTINVPDQARAVYQSTVGAQFTMRRLIQAVGIDPAAVTTWSLGGAVYDSMRGTNPLLDQPVPQPTPGVDPGIVVDLTPRQAFAPPMQMMGPPIVAPPMHGAPMPGHSMQPTPAMPVATGGQVSPEMEVLYEAIEKDWTACTEGLRELERMRKQLVDIHGRLKNMDRDLNSNERRFSSTQDKKDWVEARRWLRDGMTKTMMLVKSYDIGDVSSAGRGRHIEELYKQFIAPRTPIADLAGTAQQFVEYRKLVTTLQGRMSAAYSQSGVAAERKAQKVMKSIQAKVRKGTTRTSFLDAMTD